ncbi:unannotated protein [freshwater metagenome]|uniref:Unannotated protein n=1 Tax=freshwater metagenome TaxID=449393 RepID=A0A6J7CI35_9ZZZZ|nr:LOG family protein [Actinomycetota bacterium]MUH57610.1 Rossman fold protein, TIGR00730 family [Actinomycetota bacterium]
MTHDAEIASLLTAITASKPQTNQRSALLRSLLENVVLLAEQDPDTLDLKIAETALAELVEAFEVFAPYRNVSKVTIFGSARTPDTHPLYQLTKAFAAAMAQEGWMIITGAGPGIMAAGIEGAGREKSFGVNIRLPFEQGANEFIASDVKLVEMRYFFTRKVALTKESKGFAIFPGGYGTLDECFELLTLLQTGKAVPAPVVLIDTPDGHYWNDWLAFIRGAVISDGYVSELDHRFFTIATDVATAQDALTSFYRNYHSLRMVGHRMVLRMHHGPTSEQLEEIRSRFSHIVTEGVIEVIDATGPERSSYDQVNLARVAFTFDRRSYGEVRDLISAINSWVD